MAADGRSLGSPLDWEAVLLDLRAGDDLTLRVEGQARPLSIKATAFPSMTAARVTVLRDIELITVTPAIQLERGLVSSEGAYITGISDQLRSQLGLLPGDVIVVVNRVRMRSAEDVQRAFEVLAGRGSIQLYLERNGDYIVRNFYWGR